MKFEVKINGVEFLDFDVKNPLKAAELVKMLSDASTGCVATPREDNVFGDQLEGTIEFVLDGLRGTKTSSFIKVLAGLDGFGGTDALIKQTMADNGEINLAPFIASISKACKRGGVKVNQILIRKEKRIRAGKVLYHYQLTEKAAEYVSSIDDFEKDELFPERFNRDAPREAEAEASDNTVPFRNPPQSKRELVRVAGSEPSNISELAKKSGLTKTQVRGVINAPNEKDDWERGDDPSGITNDVHYAYRPK